MIGADRVGGRYSACHDWSFADAAIAPPALHEVEPLSAGVFACRSVGQGVVKLFQKAPATVIVEYC